MGEGSLPGARPVTYLPWIMRRLDTPGLGAEAKPFVFTVVAVAKAAHGTIVLSLVKVPGVGC